MANINAVIVDDEESARDVLSNLLARAFPEIKIVATCSNVPDAAVQIKHYNPDVVFLDVEMPNYAGYEIVGFFEKIDFEIIFITAFDQYAIKAFELSAVDYLVKPINRMRLAEAVTKLKEKVGHKKAIGDYQVLLESIKTNSLDKIVIPEIGNRRILLLNDIIAIEGKGAYSSIYLNQKKSIVVSKNLKYFENVFPSNAAFFRSHKSWIINFDCVKSYNKSKSQVLLNGDIIAKLSKYRITEFETEIAAKR